MERVYKIAFTFSLVAFTFVSCSDILDEGPRGELSDNNAYQDYRGTLEALSGVYDALGSTDGGNGMGLYSGNLILIDQLSDVTRSTDPDNYYSTISNATVTADYEPLYEIWRLSYRGINRANDFIEKAPNADFSELRKDAAIGEAKFIRALHYYNLVRLFGEVPLILNVIDKVEDSYPVASSVEEVYEAIIEDLNYAVDNLFFDANSLGEKNTPLFLDGDIGRVSVEAANALLAEVHLTIGSYARFTSISTPSLTDAYSWAIPSYHYGLAAEHSKVVIDSAHFVLDPDYSSVFDPDTYDSYESLFEVSFDGSEAESGNWGILHSSSQRIRPVNEFSNSFDPTDGRKDKIISVDGTSNQFYISKYDVPGLSGLSKNNAVLIRYSDVLLTYTEAQNDSDATEQVYEYINSIRTRAGLPDLSGLDRISFREAVWQERKWELCYELNDWFDQVRTGKLVDNVRALRNHVPDDATGTPDILSLTDAAQNIQDFHQLFPIPQKAIDNNPKLIQNPGY